MYFLDKVEEERARIINLNENFAAKTMLSNEHSLEFSIWLLSKGSNIRHCIIVEAETIYPESVYGRIIDQNGKIFKYEFYFDDIDNSDWNDVTYEFIGQRNKFGKHKPWETEVVALGLYDAYTLKIDVPSQS